MNEDIIIRVEPQLEPHELFRRSVLEKAKLGMCMGVVENEVRITVDNIGLIASLLGVDTNNEVIIDLIRDSLINNKEVIEPDDFLKLIFDKVLPSDEITEDTIRQAFSVVDVDGDDVITGADIYQVMLTMGEVVSDEELTRMLRAVDADGDGRATFEDFRNFILGIVPIQVKVPDETAEALEPTSDLHIPPAEHRRRRSLFSYGRMVKKQLEIVSKLINKSPDGCRVENTDQSEGSRDDACDTTRLTPDSTGSGSDEDYVFANLFVDDATEDVTSIMKQHTLNLAADVLSSRNPEPENETVNMNTDVPIVLKGETLNTSKLTDPKHSDKTVNLQSLYKKTSPYYGRVRPDVFSLNPLPLLPVETADDEVASHSESTRSGQCSSRCSGIPVCDQTSDKEQQTTADFKENLVEFENSDNSKTDSHHEGNDDTRCQQGEIKNNSSMTDIHGIKRFKQGDCLHNVILKRTYTSSDMVPYWKDDCHQKNVISELSTGTSIGPKNINSRDLNDYNQNPETDHVVCELFQDGMKRNQPMRPQTAKPSNRVVAHLHRKFKHSNSVTKMIPSSPELIHAKRGPTPENSKVLPMRPQTAKPCLSVHIPSDGKYNEHDSVDSKQANFYNRSTSRASLWKSKQAECAEIQHANPILLSDAIKNESLYTEEGGRSEHHRGFRSIRPLARVLMNLQASTKNTHKSLPEVSSISRMLEEEDTTFMKKVTMPTIKASSETSTAKPKLLNLDFAPDKPVRPRLKRTSTLTRIPIHLEARHTVVSRDSKTLRM